MGIASTRLEFLRSGIVQPPFNPIELFAGGVDGGWYDISDLSVLFQDSAGTTPVTTDGDPVGLIVDKSGNNHNAVQANNDRRPTFKISGTGKNYLDFAQGDHMNIDFVSSQKTLSAVEICVPRNRDFIIASRFGDSGRFVGIGQSGSGSGSLSSSSTQLGFYVDGVLSNATTRGGQFSDAQTGNVIETNYTASTWRSPLSFGQYANVNSAARNIGDMYGWIFREGGLGAFRQDVVNYGKGLI